MICDHCLKMLPRVQYPSGRPSHDFAKETAMGVNTRAIVDHWDEIRERLREHWENLTDEDLEMVRDNLNEVIGRIQLRTGESRPDTQRLLNQVAESAYGSA